jgi:superfamily II DNA or RNA helicase
MWLQDAVVPHNKGFNKIDKALELIREIRDRGEKALVFTSLRGLYRELEQAFKREWIGYTGMDGVPTQKRNDVARAFEKSDDTALLAGTGTLNRGVTINGANHVIILNTEWSPETTLQAEDRCHRPGQQKAVHVHYILSRATVEEQMWELINAKAAAQRAVFDKEALYKSVEEVMAEAVSAQLEVARRMVEVEREPLELAPTTEVEAPAESTSEQAEGQLTMFDLFQQHGAQRRPRKKQAVPSQQLSLFGTGQAA